MSYAKVTVVGNTGADPELRYNPSGVAVCQFSVAVGHSRSDGNGGWTDDGTDWYRIAVIGKRAEGAAERVRKGLPVVVTGSLRLNSYKTKAGEDRTSLEVVADTLEVFGRRERPDEAQPAAPQQRQPQPAVPAPSRRAADDDLDGLPF